VVSFPQVSQPKPSTRLSPPSTAPHAPPSSFFSILSPAQCVLDNRVLNKINMDNFQRCLQEYTERVLLTCSDRVLSKGLNFHTRRGSNVTTLGCFTNPQKTAYVLRSSDLKRNLCLWVPEGENLRSVFWFPRAELTLWSRLSPHCNRFYLAQKSVSQGRSVFAFSYSIIWFLVEQHTNKFISQSLQTTTKWNFTVQSDDTTRWTAFAS
jgi:hypothetical protein